MVIYTTLPVGPTGRQNLSAGDQNPPIFFAAYQPLEDQAINLGWVGGVRRGGKKVPVKTGRLNLVILVSHLPSWWTIEIQIFPITPKGRCDFYGPGHLQALTVYIRPIPAWYEQASQL